ncbi:MAG: hypothetical protein FJ086_11425 [Deltaproteobacteria bacterium]|nr:hypothetical protein [Deltaproteobacteria bacterium]
MGIGKSLKGQALKASQRALERLLSDEKRATQIAAAVGQVHQGRELVVKAGEDLLRTLDVAPKEDFKVVGRRLSALKRRIRELDRKLESLKQARSS